MATWIPAMRAAASMALLTALACRAPGSAVCTAQFVTYVLAVTDQAGAPAEGVDLAVTLVRTGERLVPLPLDLHPPGTYPLLDDQATTKLRPTGEKIRAVATKGTAMVQADFDFDVPDGCHVHKVSGPDTVALQ